MPALAVILPHGLETTCLLRGGRCRLMNRQQQQVIEYFGTENQVLREKLGGTETVTARGCPAMSENKQSLLADLEFLCDPALDGRAPGSTGHLKVQDFLRSRLTELGLRPLFAGSYDQPVFAGRQEVGRNLCGLIPGAGNGTILLGAHYDHFAGVQGADDNAAAVAILLELAGRLGQWSGQSSLAICMFDLEEPPHFLGPTMGSNWFVRHCPLAPQQIKCAIILDLCGHDVPIAGAENVLFATGAEYSGDLMQVVQKADTDELPMLMVRNQLIGDMSDHHAFRMWGLPFLFLSCGWWKHYHQPTDTFEKLNLAKTGRIAHMLAKLVRQMDTTSVRLTPSPDFLKCEARAFKRLTGIAVSPDGESLREAARQVMSMLLAHE